MKKILITLSAVSLVAFVGLAFAADGAALYKSCGGCHGADGAKTPGGSMALKGQSAADLEKKLQGYIDGTYGGAQKAVMVNVSKKLSPEDLKAVAEHASKL